MGVAYTDAGLTKGPIYPAVSLLHCAGCMIKG
jgi:E3 ubiquitin-protein ligase NRDP1